MKISKLEFLKKKARAATGESIEYVDVLERIYNKTRGQHNTAALITAAKKHKACIITHTAKWAATLRDDHGVDAMVYTDPKIWTFRGPVLFDMPAMWEFVQAHSRLEKSITELLNYLDLKNIS